MADLRVRRQLGAVRVLICLAAALLCACGAEKSSSPLATLSWGVPVAISTGMAANCRQFTLGVPNGHCGARDRTPAGTAAPLLTAVAVGATSDGADAAASNVESQRALVDLWSGLTDAVALDRAIASLRALAESSQRAINFADLSAALLVRHAASQQAGDLVDALVAAQRALALDGTLRAALWNRAVALTWIGLRDAQEDAWRRYTAITKQQAPRVQVAGTDFALTRSGAAYTGRWRDAATEHLWRALLPAWGRAVLAGDRVAEAAALDTLRAVAVAAERHGHDRRDGPVSLAALIDSVKWSAPSNPQSNVAQAEHDAIRRQIATGFAAYGEYRAHMDRASRDSARLALDRAEQQRAFAVRFPHWLWLQRATLLLYREPATATRLLERELPKVARTSPVVSRRARWLLGLTQMTQGQSDVARSTLEDASAACDAVGEEECTIGAGAMAAAMSLRVGDNERALRAALRLVQRSASMPLNSRRWSAINALRDAVARRGMATRGVEDVQDALDVELEGTARRLGDQGLQLNTAFARVRFALDHFDDAPGSETMRAAQEVVAHADSVWQRTTIPSLKAEFSDDVKWARGELLRTRNDPRAIALLDEAAQRAAASGNRIRALPTLLSRARAVLAMRDTLAGLRELDTLLLEYRARVRSNAGVFEEARLAQDMRRASAHAARAWLARGNAAQALAALSGRAFDDTLMTALPAGAFQIAVRELDDRLYAWHGAQGRIRVVTLPLRTPALRTLATRLDAVALRAMYDGLVAPWRTAWSTNDSTLIIDARGVAAAVPWPALRDERGAALIERTVLVMSAGAAPSVEANVEPTRATTAGSSTVTLIDAAPRAGATRLPGAVAEVASLRALWGSRAQVAQPQSAADFVRAAQRAEYVHYAGHALLDAVQPERSALRLPIAGADSLIVSAAMSGWELPRVRLFILAACDTRVAGTTASSGLESLAGVLLRAGARNVIGAGWPVDDRATATLMQALHAALRDGATPAAALRQAQLTVLRHADPALRDPRVWAAFQLLGRGD